MLVIGISGKMYSGKDTFFLMLKEIEKTKPVVRISLADALKEEVFDQVLRPNGIDREALYDDRKSNFRLLLQWWGTEFRRNQFGQDYWVKKLDEQIEALKASGFDGVVVVPDVRFEDEADYILGREDGWLVRIHRPPKGKERLKKMFAKEHCSETSLDDYGCFNYHIRNTKDLEHFKKEVSKCYEDINQ